MQLPKHSTGGFFEEPRENIFPRSFLTTVLLWCAGIKQFLIGTRPHRKKKSSYSTRRARNSVLSSFINFHRYSIASPGRRCVWVALQHRVGEHAPGEGRGEGGDTGRPAPYLPSWHARHHTCEQHFIMVHIYI